MSSHPITIDDLFRLAMVGDAQISPDGRRVAYVRKTIEREADEYQSNIWLWEDGETRQYSSGNKDSTPRWSPDGTQLAFLSGREDRAQIYVLSTAGGEARRLTEIKRGAGTPIWSPDGSRIAFSAAVSFPDETEPDEEKPKRAKTHVFDRARFKFNGPGLIDDRRTDVFVVDVAGGVCRQLTDGDWNARAGAWSPDGLHLAIAGDRDPEWDLRAFSDIWIVPRDGGEPRRVTDGDGAWGQPVFSPDGSRLAMVGFPHPDAPDCTHFPQVWSIARDGSDLRNEMANVDLSAGDGVSGDISAAGESDLVWTEAGITLLVSERGVTGILRIVDRKLETIVDGPRRVMDFTLVAGRIAFTVSDTVTPTRIALRENGEERVIADPNEDLMRELCPIKPRKVTFAGAHDDPVDGWIMEPVGMQPGVRYPLIVYIHGGPTAAYGETFFHEFQVLAAAGFGVFYSNPHGSSTYGQKFQIAIRGHWGTVDEVDLMAALDRALEDPWVDPHRVGVAGGSYGGFLVNWLISHTDRFAAAVTERGICNHVSQGGISDWAAVRGQALGGTPEENPEKLWDVSPLKYVRNVHTPTLIVHSERDDRCPIGQGEEWYMALKRLRVPVRFVRFPEETHELSRSGLPSRRTERLEHIIRWFKTYL